MKSFGSEVPYPCNSESEVIILCDSSREALLLFSPFNVIQSENNIYLLSLLYPGLSQDREKVKESKKFHLDYLRFF